MLHQQQQHHRGHAEDDDEAGAAVVDVEVVGKTGSRSRRNNCTEESSFVKHLREILDNPTQRQRYSNILRWMSNGTSIMLDISSSSRMKHQLFPKKKKQQRQKQYRDDTEDRTVTDELFRVLSVTDVYALLNTLKRNGFHTVHRNTCPPTQSNSKNTADLYFIFQRYGFVATASSAAAAAAPSFHPQTIAHEDNARAALDEQERRQPLELEVDEVGKKYPTATATAAVPAFSATSSASPHRRNHKRKRSSSSSSPTFSPKFKARIEEPFDSFVERHYDPADSTKFSSSPTLPTHDVQQSSTYSYNSTPYYYQQQQHQQEQYSQQQYAQQQYAQHHNYYQQQYQPPYNSYYTNNANLVSSSHQPWYTDSSQYYYQNSYQQQQQGWSLHPSPPSQYHPSYYSVPLHQQQQQQQQTQLQHYQFPATTMVPTSSWCHPTLTQQEMAEEEDGGVPTHYHRRRPSSAPTIVQLQQEPEHEQRRPQHPKQQHEQQQHNGTQRLWLNLAPPLPSPLTATKSSSSSASLRSSSLISFCSSQELHSLSYAQEEDGEHDNAIQHRRTATMRKPVSRSSLSSRRRISPIIMDVVATFAGTSAGARTTTTSPVFLPASVAAARALSTNATESCTGDDMIETQKIYAPHQVYDEVEGILDDNDDNASFYYTSLNDTASNCDNTMPSNVVMTNKTSSRYYD